MPSVDEDRELSQISFENEKWYSHLHMSYNPGISLLGIYLREMKTWSYENLYLNVHDSFAHITPKLRTTQM